MHAHRSVLLGAVAALALLPTASKAEAAVDSTPESSYVTNGIVSALARTSSTIYLGGEFTQVGPRTGPWVALSSSTGTVDASEPQVYGGEATAQESSQCSVRYDSGFCKHGGSVFATVSDGHGGFFVAGKFSAVGGEERDNLAHVLADGSVDPAWHPSTDGPVYSLARSGSTVYAGGFFATASGQPRKKAAAFDATTGALTSWNPTVMDPSGDGGVYALAVSGSTVYLGGQFTTVQGALRTHVAAVDATTGAPTSWAPSAQKTTLPGCSGCVYSIAVSGDGQTVYIGGDFDSVDASGSNVSTTRHNVAAFDATTGAVKAFDANADDVVNAVLVDGSTVYLGGAFTGAHAINGTTARNGAAAVDATTGAVDASWDPDVQATGIAGAASVDALAVSGSTVYLGGNFDTLNGGAGRNYLAAVNDTDGSVTGWNPNGNAQVRSLAVSGSVVSAGGIFSSFNGVSRVNAAALDASTGTVTAWDPNPDSTVETLAVSGSRVFLGGMFAHVGGTARAHVAAVDDTTGTLDGAWTRP
jgi:WD40 repeat protein